MRSIEPHREEGLPALHKPHRVGVEILVVILGALLLRSALLWAPAVDLVGWNVRGDPIDHHGEEFSRGSIATEILRGPLLPILDYQWAGNFGGSLVVGLLAIPSFLLFGSHLIALKLVPLAFALALVVAAHAVGRRLGGPAAARLCALLAAVGFPGLLVFQTIAWGTHAELASLSALFAWISLCALAQERPGALLRFVQGLMTGFTLYFGPGFALFLIPVVAFELAQRRRLPTAFEATASGSGFLLGFLPWIVYNVRHGFPALHFYGRQGVTEQLDVWWEGVSGRALGVWSEIFPRTLYVRADGSDLITPWTWVLLAAIATPILAYVVSLLRGRRLEPAWIFVAHLVLFTLASAFTRFYPQVESPEFIACRYPLLVVPSILILAGLGLASLWRGTLPARCTAALAMTLWVSISLVGTANLIDRHRAGTFLTHDAAPIAGHARWLVTRYAHDPARVQRALVRAETRRTDEERAEMYSAIARVLRNLSFPEGRRREGAQIPVRREYYHDLWKWLRRNAPEEHRHLFDGPESDPPLGNG